MKVVVVAEFYPRAHDPVLGVWTHRQALAAQGAGAEVEVVVLHRPVPSAASIKAGPRAALRELRTLASQPRRAELDGLAITYVPFVSPARAGSYGEWGRYAAPTLGRALRRLHRRFPYDLVHAHNAVPAADAVRRTGLALGAPSGRGSATVLPGRGSTATGSAEVRRLATQGRPGGLLGGPASSAPGAPMITSVHGGDLFHTAPAKPDWSLTVRAAFDASQVVVANSSGIARAARELTSSAVETLLLGADVPDRDPRPPREHALVTVAHLVDRKRHADVIRAMWLLRARRPGLRYEIVGDGPARTGLERLAAELGMGDRVRFRGQLAPAEAMEVVDAATLFVMPSVDEAYGVAYVEAMARGVPAVGSLGEPGPLDLADIGSGIQLAAPGDVEHLARVLDRLLGDPAERARLSKLGRRVMRERCSWEVVGRETVALYDRVLADAREGGAGVRAPGGEGAAGTVEAGVAGPDRPGAA